MNEFYINDDLIHVDINNKRTEKNFRKIQKSLTKIANISKKLNRNRPLRIT